MDLEEFCNIVKKIKYKNFKITPVVESFSTGLYVLHYSRIEFSYSAPDCNSPTKEVTVHSCLGLGSDTIGSISMSEKDLIQLVYNHVKAMEIHELDEWFMVDGVRMFDPHKEVT